MNNNTYYSELTPRIAELKDLRKQFEETMDLRQKAIIAKQIGDIKQALSNSKKVSKEDN